ncbi:MAG: NrfD/PsrC family molybdoenzyme membrane anchor subunit [Opitutaceae bacterium]|jgi:molybdopterin-containing oxidoreductase family membrane subunit
MSSHLEIPASTQAVLAEVNPASNPRPVLVLNDRSHAWITEKVCGVIEGKTPLWWWVCFAVSCGIASCSVIGFGYLVATGVGVWGHASPANWAWDIINFVFWVGIAHAGTLISAILCLTRQNWRTSINRTAEAMTIFSIACAGLFPALHVGRVWLAMLPGYLFPVPNANGIWPNFRSALEWDVFAVNTYGSVSLIFWYVGMIPDLGVLRDRFFKRGDKIRSGIYGFFAMGWRGSARHWVHHEMAYLLLAGIGTLMVVSVCSIVSFDFATSLIPGWHTTIFPPYFVSGAIFSGFAMVMTILLPMRAIFKFEDFITPYHIDCLCKITLVMGTLVGYAYLMEFIIAWYGANPNEGFTFVNRTFGLYDWAYWIMFSCNVITPQFFWFKKVRSNFAFIFILTIFINIGMWFERFVIIVTSLARDFLPSSWGYYSPSIVEILTFFGTFGVFAVLFLLFFRFLPIIPMSEVKTVTRQADVHGGKHS